jgi:hypothetical protein
MYANDKAMADRWEKHTPKSKKLPEKVKKQTNKNAELKSGFKRNSMDVNTQELSDIQKLAYVAAFEKEKKAGVLGAGLGAALGAGLQKRRNEPLLRIGAAKFKSPIMDYLHKKLPMGSPLAGAALGGLMGHVGEEGVNSLTELFSGNSEEDKRKEEKEGSEKQANLASIIKALKAFGKRTLAPAAGTGLVGYGVGKSKGYGQGFESGQDSIKEMNLKEIMDLAMPKLEVAKQASAIQELAKEAGKRGLWDNIHAKRKRGEKPAKKGDKDYPDEKSWKKTTKASK